MISMIFMYKTWGDTKSWRHLRIPMSVTKQKPLSWMKSPPNQQGLAVMKNASSLKANSFSQRCPPLLSGAIQIHTSSSLLLLFAFVFFCHLGWLLHPYLCYFVANFSNSSNSLSCKFSFWFAGGKSAACRRDSGPFLEHYQGAHEQGTEALNTQGPVRPAPSLWQLSDSCSDCMLLVCNKECVNEVSSVGVLRSALSPILMIALKALLHRTVSSQHASTQHRIARVGFCSTMGPPGRKQGLHGPVPSKSWHLQA